VVLYLNYQISYGTLVYYMLFVRFQHRVIPCEGVIKERWFEKFWNWERPQTSDFSKIAKHFLRCSKDRNFWPTWPNSFTKFRIFM